MAVQFNKLSGMTNCIIVVYNDIDNIVYKLNYYKIGICDINFDEIYSRILDDVIKISKNNIVRSAMLNFDNAYCVISDDLKSVKITQPEQVNKSVAYLHTTDTRYIKL